MVSFVGDIIFCLKRRAIDGAAVARPPKTFAF